MPKFIASAIALFLCLGLAAPPISVKATPGDNFGPAAVRIVVTLEPDDRNKWLDVVAVCASNGWARLSGTGLAGAKERKTNYIDWLHVPGCGEPYQVIVFACERTGRTPEGDIQCADGGRVLTSRTTFRLLCRFCSEEPP